MGLFAESEDLLLLRLAPVPVLPALDIMDSGGYCMFTPHPGLPMRCPKCVTVPMKVAQSKHSRRTPRWVRMIAHQFPDVRTRQMKCPVCGHCDQTVEIPVRNLQLILKDMLQTTFAAIREPNHER